jgi:hypothetical protein
MNRRRTVISICPLNLECLERLCPNTDKCSDLAISWELPYNRTKEGLFVRQFVYRTRWQKQARNSMILGDMPYCPLPSGDYASLWDDDYHEREMRSRIKQSLEEAGWSAAVEIPTEILQRTYEDWECPF